MTARRNRRSKMVIALLCGCAALPAATACGGDDTSPNASPSATGDISTPEVVTATSPEPNQPPSHSPSPSPTGPPAFAATVKKLTRAQVASSWHQGCPVSVSELRAITMTYWGFDDKAHTGTLVVNAAAADKLVSVFKRLYGMRYPIRKMVPVDAYKGSDYASIDADNTSAFNCRNATGSNNWSQHAFGLAVDLNPRENPYVYANGSNAHRNADAYVERPLHKPGVINPGDRVVRAFSAIGWGWGGSWSGARDYQHFSSSGR
ncbi:M15 family metallopeptidase [Streptosporangiaceae bacterium NEAU-GS5]|nr:M15 family metallopeptidase [Streptosporangiaceae bacterium NEAU-GS5]